MENHESFNNPQLKLALEFVQLSGVNIFLTGKAGTGKTTFLRDLKMKSPKRMVVVAPTGVAAINAGGVTIHSFFQMPFGPYIPDQRFPGQDVSPEAKSAKDYHKFSREKINIIRSLDLLVIDEISMVRADLLDGIDAVLRRFRDYSKPFGGIQLLMIGDLQQLAPVVKEDEWEILGKYYDTCFFFSSNALRKTNYISIELKHIYRQSDAAFIELLNRIRDNKLDSAILAELNKRFLPNFDANKEEGYITLTTHNYQAQGINESKLKKLQSKPMTFSASIDGDFPEYSFPTDSELTLKIGAQVMFVKNDSSREKLYFNGKIGTIADFDEDTILVNCPGELSPIPVKRAEWQNAKYTLDENTNEIKETVAGTFVQYPLKLAWAITIHKSQGLTFEKAIIDANAAFAHGQVYVALSRCKTLEGLVLSTPISQKNIKSNNTVSRFIQEVEQNQPDDRVLTESKHAYQQSLLMDLFDFSVLRRRSSYLLKLLNEYKENLLPGVVDSFLKMNDLLKSEIIDVSDKFKNQVQFLIQQQRDIEQNIPLQDRIKKAATYFSEKIETNICNLIDTAELETDNKAVRKSLKDALGRFKDDVYFKLSCSNASENGFYIREYLQARANASIEKPEKRKIAKIKFESVSTDILHPELFSRLKTWRNDMARELNLPVYMVLQQKTMADIVSFLPASVDDLHYIKGFGKQKIKNFGEQIISIVNQYCNENNIQVRKKL